MKFRNNACKDCNVNVWKIKCQILRCRSYITPSLRKQAPILPNQWVNWEIAFTCQHFDRFCWILPSWLQFGSHRANLDNLVFAVVRSSSLVFAGVRCGCFLFAGVRWCSLCVHLLPAGVRWCSLDLTILCLFLQFHKTLDKTLFFCFLLKFTNFAHQPIQSVTVARNDHAFPNIRHHTYDPLNSNGFNTFSF